MEELAALGFNAHEIMKAMPSVISASEASGADMAETATIMASSLNAFGLEAKDSGHVADLLAMAANKSAADISYMGDALKYAGPPANSLGVSLEDTSAAIGIMSDAGLEGSQAGTALRASFIKLAKPTKASAKVMEEMGISLSDSKGNFVGMPALIKQFKDGMKGMTKEQKLANVAQIVGTESASGFLTLIDAGPSKIDKFSKSLKNSDGASKKAADRMKDNLKGSLEQLGGAFESAGIIIGNLFAPILRKLADTITWLVEKLNGMSRGMQITMVVLATLAAAIGPVVFVLGAFISVIGSAMSTLLPLIVAIGEANGIMAFLSGKLATAIKLFPMLGKAIGIATGPVGWIVAGIVALGAAFVIAYKNSETFRNVVNGALNGVKQTFITIGNIVKGFFQLFKGNGQDGVITLSKILPPNLVVGITNFANKVKTTFFQVINGIKSFGLQIGQQLSTFWRQNGTEITQAVSKIANVISTVFSFIWNSIIKPIMTLIWNLMKIVWPAIRLLVVSVWQNIKGVIQGSLNIILGIIKVFSALFTGNWRGVWQGVVQILKGAVMLAWNLVQLWFVGKMLKVVSLGLGLVRGVVTKGWTFIKNFIGKMAQGAWTSVRLKFSGLLKSVRTIFSNLSKFCSNLWLGLKNKITSLGQAIWTNIRNRFNGLLKSTRTIFSNLGKWTRNLWTNLKNSITKLASKIWDNVKNKFNGLSKSARSIFNNLSKFSRELWTNLKNRITSLAQTIWTNVKNKFTGMWKNVKNILTKLFNNSKSIFTNIKNKITSLANSAKDNVVSGFKGMFNKGKEWINKLKDFITGSKDKFKKAALSLGKSAANGAIGGLNKMIGGINKISKAITDKNLIKEIPKLSTGTSGAISSPTAAIVNDKGVGNGSGVNGHQEIIARRDGTLHAPVGRNVLVGLDKGDSVIKGRHTQQLVRTGVIPKFANGKNSEDMYKQLKAGVGAGFKATGKSLESGYHSAKEGVTNAKDYAKEKGTQVVNKAKDGASYLGDKLGDVWDYVKNPGKLVNKVLGNINFGGKNANATMRMAGGAFSKLKKSLVNKVKSMFEEAEGGDGDAGWLLKKHNILQYFGRYTGGLMFNGGRHYGIDFAMPTGTPIKALTAGRVSQAGWVNGGGGNQVTLDEQGGKYFQWYMHMKNGGVKVKSGQKVQAGDLLGYSGSTGNSTTPHLHIQRMKGRVGNDTAMDNVLSWLKGLGSSGTNKAASKWKGDIKRAAKRMNVNLAGGELKGIIAQIQRESNGNAGVTQDARLKDGNSGANLAQGLLQYVPNTFKNYAVKGHGNIKSGYDQLLAFFNNSNWRRDLPYGKSGWGPSGSRRFATGGKVWNGLYHLGEEGYPEWIIPSDPSRSEDSWKLLALAANDLEKSSPKSKRPNNLPNPSNGSGGNNSNLERKFDVLISLVSKLVGSNEEIANKDYEPSINKYSLENEIFKAIDKYDRLKQRKAKFS